MFGLAPTMLMILKRLLPIPALFHHRSAAETPSSLCLA
jgi:hypothetical protein